MQRNLRAGKYAQENKDRKSLYLGNIYCQTNPVSRHFCHCSFIMQEKEARQNKESQIDEIDHNSLLVAPSVTKPEFL